MSDYFLGIWTVLGVQILIVLGIGAWIYFCAENEPEYREEER